MILQHSEKSRLVYDRYAELLRFGKFGACLFPGDDARVAAEHALRRKVEPELGSRRDPEDARTRSAHDIRRNARRPQVMDKFPHFRQDDESALLVLANLDCTNGAQIDWDRGPFAITDTFDILTGRKINAAGPVELAPGEVLCLRSGQRPNDQAEEPPVIPADPYPVPIYLRFFTLSR